jgi:hypothetical protein
LSALTAWWIAALRRGFWQPFDGAPIGARGERRRRGLALMDRVIVEYDNDRLGRAAGLWPIALIERFEKGDEIGLCRNFCL